jgi:spermidine synthase
MFGPKLLEEVQSKYSGPLRVMQAWGYRYVSTGYWTQSGGIIKDVWQPVFKKLKPQKNKSWLILGLAAGTLAKMIPQPAQITCVEIDPAMIAIGKKYFGLSQIPNLKIIQKDAKDYLLTTKDRFDFILVDMYLGDQLPKFVYSQKFLGQLEQLGQLVIVNNLFYTDTQKITCKNFIKSLEKIFPKIELIRSLTNLLVICRGKSDT